MRFLFHTDSPRWTDFHQSVSKHPASQDTMLLGEMAWEPSCPELAVGQGLTRREAPCFPQMGNIGRAPKHHAARFGDHGSYVKITVLVRVNWNSRTSRLDERFSVGTQRFRRDSSSIVGTALSSRCVEKKRWNVPFVPVLYLTLVSILLVFFFFFF